MTAEMEAPQENESVSEPGPLEDFEEISEKFFKLCEGLEQGELVATSKFKMSEVMSAIELMEPKMDVGVNSQYIKTLKSAVDQGLYIEDFPNQIAIIDGTIAMLVAWLDGASLGSTVWTNILLANVRDVQHPVFRAFCAGTNLLVRNINALVSTVGNLEEMPEDFNPQMLLQNQTWVPRIDITRMLRDQIQVFAQLSKSCPMVPRVEQVCAAFNARFEFIIILLELLGYLVPPEIEDPNFQFTNGQCCEAVCSHTAHTAEKQTTTQGAKNTEGKSDDVLENMIGEFVENLTTDSVQEGIQAAAKKEPEPGEKPEEKPEEKPAENPAENPEENQEQVEDEQEDEQEDEEEPLFKPNFQIAQILAKRFTKVCSNMAETVKFGRRAPDDVDGNYDWLIPFEPKACVSITPACFPRTVKVPTRIGAMDWWKECAARIERLVYCCPGSVKDLNTLFYFARNFTLDADVFTRSLLQVCMFPIDSHLLGDDNMTVADPIEVTLSNCYIPQVLEQGSPVRKDVEARALYTNFLNHMTKLAITLYSSFGMNLSRQRDRLETVLEDLSRIHTHAGALEDRTNVVMIQSGKVKSKEENPSYHGMVTFVFHNLLAMSYQYIELGFRMDLYVPYEFPYIFWWIGDVHCRWIISTMERSTKIQIEYLSSVTMTKTQEENKEILRKLQFQKNFSAHVLNAGNQYAMISICDGIIKLTVAMIRKGLIKMPEGGDEAERLRFERRFEVFENLGRPLSVTYEEYKNSSRVDELYEKPLDELINLAKESFMASFRHLKSLDNSKELNEETNHLIMLSKSNALGCGFLNNPELAIEWTFNSKYPVFPIISCKRK